MDVGTSGSSQPSRDWQDAIAALKRGEARVDAHANLLLLSIDVIRARNALTMERVRVGREVPDDVLQHLTRDDQLLREGDDAARSTFVPTGAP